MMKSPTVFIVDDDDDYRESLCFQIQSLGWNFRSYASAEEYLEMFNPNHAGCLLVDVRMPSMSGLALLDVLKKMPLSPAVIMMSGFADVSTALRTIKQGAVDYLQKTVSETELYEAIQRAIAIDGTTRRKYERNQTIIHRFHQLSNAENDVLKFVLHGETNKRIAAELGISQRAVEDRRARLMHKLETRTVADLIRMAIGAGLPEFS